MHRKKDRNQVRERGRVRKREDETKTVYETVKLSEKPLFIFWAIRLENSGKFYYTIRKENNKPKPKQILETSRVLV